MPAAVNIERWTGPPGAIVKTNISSLNTVAAAVDQHQSNAATAINPIRIPSTGVSYSYWIWTTLNVSVSPSARLNNFRWYTDGTNNLGTGKDCKAGWTTIYKQATGTVGSSGLPVMSDPVLGPTLTNNGSWATAFDRTVSSNLLTGTNTAVTSTGPIPLFVLLQVEIDSTAEAGISPQENFTWVADET